MKVFLSITLRNVANGMPPSASLPADELARLGSSAGPECEKTHMCVREVTRIDARQK
jgi:hypothetical protein